MKETVASISSPRGIYDALLTGHFLMVLGGSRSGKQQANVNLVHTAIRNLDTHDSSLLIGAVVLDRFLVPSAWLSIQLLQPST
jgi:hypothetical protein